MSDQRAEHSQLSEQLSRELGGLDDIRERLARLEAREEIARLIASYGPAVDSGSARDTADLWEDHGRYAFSTGDDLANLVGRDQIEEMVESSGHQGIIVGGSSHFLGPARIELDGDRAVATCYSMLVRYDAAAGRHYVDRVGANRWVLRRSDHRWAVVERVNHLLDGRAEARALLARAPSF